MSIDSKLTDEFECEIGRSRNEIIRLFTDRKDRHNWTDLLTETIDFDEVTIGDDELVVNRRPAFLAPFRPIGTIELKLFDAHAGTIIKGKSLLYSGNGTLLVILIISFFSLWTLVTFLLTPELPNAWLMVAFAWTTFGLLIFVLYKVHRRGLVNYAKKILMELDDSKKASR